MLNLLENTQQIAVKGRLSEILRDVAEQGKYIYAVLEPPQDKAIKDIFSITAIKYYEPFLQFDERFEDVGPRIARLGENNIFDDWIIEKAFFNRWTSLFISSNDITVFTQHIAYLCNAVTFEHKSAIFRCYTPTILNEWLTALQRERLTLGALGIICTDILYVMDFPEQIAHCHFQADGRVIRKIRDILKEKEIILEQPSPLSNLTDISNTGGEQWLITENQQNSLYRVRAHYLVHTIRNDLLCRPDIREKYSPVEIHQQLIELTNLCFQHNVMETFFISTFAKLCVDNRDVWEEHKEECIAILKSKQTEEEKLEVIAMILEENEKYEI